MIAIDRLRLTLPAGWAPRAARIARLVGDELAREAPAVAGDLRLAQLAVPALEVHPRASDREVAGTIAGAIHRQLRS